MRILKFGGKSLETVEKTQNVCKFIKKCYQKDKNLVIIVSAMGNETDNLNRLAEKFNADKLPQREYAKLLSCGETISSALIAMCLCSMNVPAKSLSGKDIGLSTFGGYTNAVVSSIAKYEIIKCMQSGVVAVVAGFQGKTQSGEISTLRRGGSDTTAVAIGIAFNLKVEIYSDFAGIFAGDPRFLPFKKIEKIDFKSLTNMTLTGSRVFSEEGAKLAEDFETELIFKSSEFPEKNGSIVSKACDNFVCISNSQPLRQILIISNSNKNKKFISKIVKKVLKSHSFYNFSVKNKNISFYVLESEFLSILRKLSEELNLLEKK